MKKIIMAVAIVCAAAIAQASTVSWGLSSAIDAEKFATGTAYLVCLSDIARPTFSDDAAAQAWYKDNGASLASKAFRTTTVTAGLANASEVIESPTGRKNYWMIIVNGDATEMAVTTSTKALNIQAGTMASGAAWTNTQVATYGLTSVPEPTSGLLLLLGMAGLALKRKRA